jgi:hypothetical protein
MDKCGFSTCGGSPGISGAPEKPAFGFLGWIYAGEQGFQALRKEAVEMRNTSLPVGRRAIGVPSKRRFCGCWGEELPVLERSAT